MTRPTPFVKIVIPALALIFFLSSCDTVEVSIEPAEVITPTITATAIPTVHVTPTPQPQATLTPVLVYKGPLTLDQQEKLHQASLQYLSDTPEDAFETARRLGYLKEYGNPATVCGPLSLAILEDAGLVDRSIPLKNFYYLNPRPDYDADRLLEVFPPDNFEKIVQDQPINQVDYSENPLYAGDFLYLFAGDSGSYEHMLVVTRVDDAGRAYSVTNVRTIYGFVIREVMLYDPNDPGNGVFYDWTNWEFRKIGRTGYGGFWLWRLKTTP